MNRRYLSLYLCFFAVVFVALPRLVRASAQSDYLDQFTEYRRSYAEYLLIKKDYLANPTLDNQQKSILISKQLIFSRDKSKSLFANFLNDSLTARKLNMAQFIPFQEGLASASAFYELQASLSQKIATPSDLLSFSKKYLEGRARHDNYFFYGSVANKVAQQVQFQVEAKRLLDTLYPKLPNPLPTLLQSRMDEISILASEINTKISLTIDSITQNNNAAFENSALYFENKTRELQSIKQLQLKMIDLLIDIDQDYGQKQN